MHISFLDPYQPRPSLIHRLDARVKLVLALSFILATALAPPGAWPVYVLLFALVFAVEILSELGVGHVLRRALIALPFALAALPVLFTVPGPALLTLPIGPWDLTITGPGLERFISILLKSWISVQMAIVLAASTAFPDLLMAMRAIRVPRLLVAIFGLMWRYLFVLADEALRLLRARSARSGLLLAMTEDYHGAREHGHDSVPSVSVVHLHGTGSTVAGKVGGTVAWRARDGRHGRQPVPAVVRAFRPHLRGDGRAGLRRRGAGLPPAADCAGFLGRPCGRFEPVGLLTLFGYLFWG